MLSAAVQTVLARSLAIGIALACVTAATAQEQAWIQARYGARVDIDAFSYRRDLAARSPGLTQIRLDAAVLAHTRVDFADLRIVASDGRQVPYVVERLGEQLSMQLPALEKEKAAFLPIRGTADGPENDSSRGRAASGYAVRLPYAHLGPAQLRLSTPARVFDRTVWLQIGGEPGERSSHASMRWTSRSWSHADPDSDAPPLTIDIADLRGVTLHLVIDEGDNAPLPIGRPILLLPAYRVRFVRPDATPLLMVYGNRDIEPPRYDLALLARRLLESPAAPAALGPEQPSAEPRLSAGLVFWSALALAVAGLAALLVRLLRTTGGR